MTPRGGITERTQKRRPLWGFALLAAAAALVTACSTAVGTGPGAPEGAPSGPMLVVIGDSYSEGVDNSVVWPELLAESRGYRLANLSYGGTGYVNGAFASTFGARIGQAKVADPSLIIFAGSRNDIWFSPAEVREAARKAFATAQERFPRARIIAIGPIWDSSNPTDEMQAVNSAVSEAAEAARVDFIDALSADWLADQSLIHVDGIHATDAGQQALADGVEREIPDLP